MIRILVSACLLGARVSYDGQGRLVESPLLDRWRWEGRLIPVCPEVEAGLPVPRPAAEICDGEGLDVLRGAARVVDRTGRDLTLPFVQGARHTLALATNENIGLALLKARSPSCGSGRIHDGTFSGRLRPGSGVTTALLKSHGLQVFDQDELEDLERVLVSLDGYAGFCPGPALHSPLTYTPCVGCGWCCLNDPCADCQRRYGYTRRCPDLCWDVTARRYLCRMMSDPVHGEEVRRGQHVGQGCCAPLNPWRDEVRNRDDE